MKSSTVTTPSKTNGHAIKRSLPRRLTSHALQKKRDKLVVVFQGGSPSDRMSAAHELAEHLELKLYRVALRPFISRFIGETEKNLDRIFGTVEPHHTLLYFDEADSLFGKEPPLPDGWDRSAKWWVPHLNKKVKEFPGTVLFATSNHSRTSKIARQLKPVITRLS